MVDFGSECVKINIEVDASFEACNLVKLRISANWDVNSVLLGEWFVVFTGNVLC
jgi:hypothetical protein